MTKRIAVAILAVLTVVSGVSQTRPGADRDRFIGAWRLASITGPDGKPVTTNVPIGMLIYTADGHMSVQLMYPKSASTLSNEYVRNGYEASFGSYDINDATHTLTHHVQGSNTGDLLVGKDLPREYQFGADGRLVIKSARPDEHWSATWERHRPQLARNEPLEKERERMNSNPSRSALTLEEIRTVSPALAKYTQSSIGDDLWRRPDLSPRDRGIVTVAALIARNQTIGMLHYFNMALDHGVKPAELSEIITHLAFYSGWSNALSAVAIAKDIFAQRGIGPDQLPAEAPELLPIDQAAEADRAARVQQDVGPVAPGVVQYTGDLLFHELWLRPALAPRDRSLVTVSALIAFGQVAQVPYHLNRAMNSGLTKAEASEVLTHLAFYAGWPNVMSAVPVVKGVFEKRND
jgi:4-carboxymuconolactone decarboxylase